MLLTVLLRVNKSWSLNESLSVWLKHWGSTYKLFMSSAYPRTTVPLISYEWRYVLKVKSLWFSSGKQSWRGRDSKETPLRVHKVPNSPEKKSCASKPVHLPDLQDRLKVIGDSINFICSYGTTKKEITRNRLKQTRKKMNCVLTYLWQKHKY